MIMQLNTLYFSLSQDERSALAEKAGLAPGYLWQIATRWRGKRPSLETIQRLVAADERLALDDLMSEFSTPPKLARQESLSPMEASHA